ncbi:lytic murein transglycosylase [Agrobacterium tumefaciens]|nr:lytic murein transglycosylase [Agrobacterium tumefaciens]
MRAAAYGSGGGCGFTPLCPAGHLPLKGGDRLAVKVSPIATVENEVLSAPFADLPLEGEMPGRAEGG